MLLDLFVKVTPSKYKPMEVDALNQLAEERAQNGRVTFDCSKPTFLTAGGARVEDRSKRTETVRPQLGEHCEDQPECDSAGFDDGSAQVRNIRDPGQLTVKEHQEHMTIHRPYRSWSKFCLM